MFTLKKLKKNEEGIALMSVLFIFCIAGVIAITTFINNSHEGQTIETNLRYNQSLYTTEAAINGISFSLRNINNWDDAVWSDRIGNPVSTVGGTAVLDNITFDMPNFTSDITVTGTASASDPRQVMVRIYGTLSPFDHGACGCTSLHFMGLSNTDAYDSDNGAYGAGGNTLCNGDVGSNGDIDLSSSAVCGDVEAGGDLNGMMVSTVSGEAELGGSSIGMSGTVAGGITEGISPPPTPCQCTLDVNTPLTAAQTVNDNGSVDPSYMKSPTEFEIKGNNTTTLDCGTYYFTSFMISGNASVTASTVCNDANPIRIFLDGGGPFTFAGNGLINTPERATNLRIYSDTTEPINFSGSSNFAGLVYTPNAEVNVNVGGGNFYGAYVAATSNILGGVNLHYDVQMANILDLQDGYARLTRLQWQENPL